LETRVFKRVERLVRNAMWKGRPQAPFYAALEWLYGWNADDCLSRQMLPENSGARASLKQGLATGVAARVALQAGIDAILLA
jgi:hypothetical protein